MSGLEPTPQQVTQIRIEGKIEEVGKGILDGYIRLEGSWEWLWIDGPSPFEAGTLVDIIIRKRK